MSLETLLPQLGDPGRPPSATELASLDRLSGEGHAQFLSVWRGLSIQRRRDVVDMLADIAEDNAELNFNAVFLIGLIDDDVQVRAESIKALWEYDHEDLVPVLLRLLHDPEALVRAEAALGLGRYLLRAELSGEDGESTGAMEEALRSVAHDEEELTEVRGRAIEAVGVRTKEWVHDLVEEAYESGDRRMTISAVHAMGRSADRERLPTLIGEMESDDAEMRFEAATAAGAIGDERAIPELAKLVDDEDAEVQEAAIAALGVIGGPLARSVLHSAAAEQTDERVLGAISDALSEADFVEDPLGFKMYLDQSVADDADEDDEE